MKKNVMLMDFSGIAFTTLFVNQITLDNMDFYKFLILKQIQQLIKNMSPSEVVLCCDGGSWRKDYFEHYKFNRKKLKDNSSIDFDKVYVELDSFLVELRDTFNYTTLRITKAEGDDLMAVLALNLQDKYNVIIVSSDHDLIQLSNENIKVWNFAKHRLEEKTPNTLNELVLGGCKSDKVPNVMSDDDAYVNEEKRQKPFGEKKIEKVLAEGLSTWLESQTEEIKKNYERNKKLVTLDLNTIPTDVQAEIMAQYSGGSLFQTNPQKILDFFIDHQMSSLYESVDAFLLNGIKSGLVYKPTADDFKIEGISEIHQSVDSIFE